MVNLFGVLVARFLKIPVRRARCKGFYRPTNACTTGWYKQALRDHGLKTTHGDDASAQPGKAAGGHAARIPDTAAHTANDAKNVPCMVVFRYTSRGDPVGDPQGIHRGSRPKKGDPAP